MKKRIAILGATGSIGTQTLDVVRQHPDRFEVVMISACSSVDLLAAQAREFGVRDVVIVREDLYGELSSKLPAGSRAHSGGNALEELVCSPDVDIVVGAMVGFSGLRPTLAALEAGKDIALANKETLVAAGSIVMNLAKRKGARILPVDSEHSAIFQCLQAAGDNPVSKIHLTASGGPFRTWPKEKIETATAADALKHPSWDMGAKVTIDSSTLMNKGFEVMEAKWLFGIKDVNVVVHPESVIHSMIEFADGSVIAQLATPDMRLPIQYALGYPGRMPLDTARLDFRNLNLHFEEPDTRRFPCLELAFKAMERGGNIPCALNAANEIAVKAFLEGKVRFYDIPRIVFEVMDSACFIAEPSTDDIFSTDSWARARAIECI